MIERTQALLPPGTQIRHMVIGSTRGIWLLMGLMLLGILPGALIFVLINRNRIVAVTQAEIFVLDCGRGQKPKRVLTVLPRANRLGPPAGFPIRITVGREHLFAGTKFRSEILAADAEAPQAAPAGLVPMSPDGSHWWDGTSWVDCAEAAPPFAPHSPDGAGWWDGVRWRPVPPVGPGASGGPT